MIDSFQKAKDFLESWGLHFDTPDDESNDIPYPQIYVRMQQDALTQGGQNFCDFISRITDTTDGRTYLVAANWSEIQDTYEHMLCGW